MTENCSVSSQMKWQIQQQQHQCNGLFPGLSRWAGTRKVKPTWILLKQETVSGSSISWTIYKSACRFRQITMPAPHHSVFYRPDALPAAQPTVSKLKQSHTYWYNEIMRMYMTRSWLNELNNRSWNKGYSAKQNAKKKPSPWLISDSGYITCCTLFNRH